MQKGTFDFSVNVPFDLEAGGIEPPVKHVTTDDEIAGCDLSGSVCAASALQYAVSSWQHLALVDADLQAVISQWNALPTAIRNAIIALAKSQ